MTDTMTYPVEMIVTERLHRVHAELSQSAALHSVARKVVPDYDAQLSEELARQCLCALAHKAFLAVVLDALKAVGAMSEPGEILARYQAIAEQRREARR